MSNLAKNPMQPFVMMDDGILRFKKNAIVRYLLDHGGLDLNHLACQDFSQDDWQQFSQLIGYSLCGYHELSQVSDASALQATQNARTQFQRTDLHGCRDDGCAIHCGIKEE